MIKLRNSFFIGILMLNMVSCSERPILNLEEFRMFLANNKIPFANNEVISGVDYKVSLDPPELLMFRNNIQGQLEKNKELEKYNKSVYCSFIIKDHQNSSKVKQLIYSKEDYFKLVGIANLSLQKNFKLIINNETISCNLCHMEPPSSVNPELRIVVCFDYDPNKLYGVESKGCEIIFDDDIFNNGILKFAFDETDLKKWPELKS